MNKKIMQIILLLCSIALLLTLAGCKKTAADAEITPTDEAVESKPDDTAPAEVIEPTGEMGVASREDFDKEETKPQETEPQKTEPQETFEQPEGTEVPSRPEGPADEPSDTVPPAQSFDPSQVTYAQFLAMTDEEEEAFVDSFPSLRDFNNWRNAALKNEPDRDKEVLGGNEIDLSKP